MVQESRFAGPRLPKKSSIPDENFLDSILQEETFSQGTNNEKLLSKKDKELKKQISIMMPLSEWKSIRSEAARRNISITQLCRSWLASDLRRLMQDTES